MRIRLLALLMLCQALAASNNKVVWRIGEKDGTAREFAMAPADYESLIRNDFGFEDRYFLVGYSDPGTDFPYVLPGPSDRWAGSSHEAGCRTQELNILFGLEKYSGKEDAVLAIDLAGVNKGRIVLKVVVNGTATYHEIGDGDGNAIFGDIKPGEGRLVEIPLKAGVLKEGGNQVTLTILEGSWIVFDQIRLEGSENMKLHPDNRYAFVRSVEAADYELDNPGRVQPLLVDVEHLNDFRELSVRLNGRKIYSAHLDSARYVLEVPMKAVKKARKARYKVLADGILLEKGKVMRAPKPLQTHADYVDTRMGTAHSRWMIAPGPWMPFSMVKLSPDNENAGWQSGYQPSIENIGCFSHIHEWTMAALGVMPTNGPLQTRVGDQYSPDEGYRSRIDKSTEKTSLGSYSVFLSDTRIWAEMTATERASFMRFTFPDDQDGRVMIDLHIPAEYRYDLVDVDVRKVSDYRIEGISHQLTPRPHVWSDDADQDYIVHFVMEFDAPILRTGAWKEDEVMQTERLVAHGISDGGMFVEFDTKEHPVVMMRTGISLVSLDNAGLNLRTEISDRFGWDFQAVVDNQKAVWNDILDRIDITTDDRLEKVRFYTNMYRANCRNLWSDVNGDWVAPDEKVRHIEKEGQVALGCDAFWNTFWNLNQFWNLVTPEWSSRWVNSQLALYDACGWLGKGPAGMEYIPVMVAEHEIPLIVSAYQMGIRDYDTEHAFEAIRKMQTTPATQVAGGFAGNRDLVTYLKYHYIPYENGRFSNTLEYSFDDWTVSQMAEALGKSDDAKVFADRGTWWKNAINPENGYAHMRDVKGRFMEDFDPFRSGANRHYVEGNGWQLSYFVPQDVPGLVEIMGRKDFVERLEWGFRVSESTRFNSPNEAYWDYPVVQGNQQSMHFAFLFNWAGSPWLTQKWARSVADRYYGTGVSNAYLGDEDQGQMSAWFVMAALGLFQTDGGCRVDPIYEIASPIYPKVVIKLGNRYGRGDKFVIEARNASRRNIYVQSAVLNGKTLQTFHFAASELLQGGSLVLVMGPEPNKEWGID
ncbi:MAG: GH92 family glycosyl hydrolase [Bacteroidales bacterium]|nr:GH92 family glycosyl hydrolase [Bacteroidales bacterium]